MRRAVPILALVLVAAVAAAVALARVGEAPAARAAVTAASGAFRVASSGDGQPIFAASGIGPGGSARGTVVIADTGSVPVRLTLSSHDLADTPGAGGGVLSAALSLTVTDVTAPAVPVGIYAGPLDSMPEQPAGRIEPGATRSYEFVATLPAGGAVDQNAVQGASVSVAYRWTATEAQAETTSAPKSESSPVGNSPVTSQPAPLRLTVTRARKKLEGGKLLVWASCDAACGIVVKGRLRAAAGPHRRGAKIRFGVPSRHLTGVQKLRIPVPAKLRRWLAAAPGKRKLRAKLSFVATAAGGATAAVKRTLKLRPPPRR